MAKRPCTGQAGSNENPSVIAVLTAGRWQSPSMPGRHARGQLAAPVVLWQNSAMGVTIA